MAEFERVGDQTFRVACPDKFPKYKYLQFHVSDKRSDGENSFNLAQKALQVLTHSEEKLKKSRSFGYAGKRWKLVYSSQIKWYHKLLVIFFPCYKLPIKERVPRFIIKRVGVGVKETCTIPEGLTREEYNHGIRGKLPIDDADSFASLAKVAFERYENRYLHLDAPKPSSEDYCFIQVGTELQLIQKSSRLANVQNMQAAIVAYRECMLKLHGEEKVERINQAYQLKLGSARTLTPEQVLRFNKGLQGIYPSFERTGYNDYQWRGDSQRAVQLHVSDRSINAEGRFQIAQKALKELYKSKDWNKAVRFCYGGVKWKVVFNHRIRWYHYILNFFLPFYHLPIQGNRYKFSVTRASIGPTKQLKLDFRYLVQKDISIAEYNQGVRAKANFQKESALYEDPFTRLAALALQRYEENYFALDGLTPAHNQYRIIKIDNTYKLVRTHLKNGTLNPLITQNNLIAAMTDYLVYVRKMHGPEKFEYINEHYGLGLSLDLIAELLNGNYIPGLTPEHIYRFNIGTTNFEIQELKSYWEELDRLCKLPLSGDSVLEVLRPQLPDLVWKGICNFLQKLYQEDVTLVHLRKWKEQWPASIQEMSSAQFETFFATFRPSREEIEKAYTGKKIVESIRSSYTTADTGDYKPWIDQQELTQICQELYDCKSWEAYQELLAHVVVKKHLARRDANQGYRVGALIPAPSFMGAVWYTVTSCITNQYTYSYTLEPVCADRPLPAIKLYRSTAGSRYALFGAGSIMNDFNHLNSPGYMGVKTLQPYEHDFFHKRTIPLWVGYQHAAEMKLREKKRQPRQIFVSLSRSMKELLKSHRQEEHTKSFREILREHDTILNELLRYQNVSFNRRKRNFKAYMSHLDGIIRNYMQSDRRSLLRPQQAIKRDATKLKKILVSELRAFFPSKAAKLKEQEQVIEEYQKEIMPSLNDDLDQAKKLILQGKASEASQLLTGWKSSSQDANKQYEALILTRREILLLLALIKDLEEHVLNEQIIQHRGEELQEFMQEVYAPLQKLQTAAKDAIDQHHTKEAFQYLEQWNDCLRLYAREKGEDVASKIQQDIDIAGHSLGGACAQLAYVQHLIGKERIPLPGRSCTGYFFDDPAINAEENIRFKSFGKRHGQLFQQLNTCFKIFRRQEVRDFVPKAGEEHLGATFTDQEAKQVAQWLGFNAAVQERLLCSNDRQMMDVEFAHETRFLHGVREVYHVSRQNPDYSAIFFNTRAQGTFDSRGKKGDTPYAKARILHLRLYEKIWKLPKRLRFLFQEEKRKSLSFPFTYVRRLVFSKRQDAHKPTLWDLDLYGILVVKSNT